MGRNVNKTETEIFQLPQDAIQEDRGLSTCGVPQLVLASISDVVSYKNDRTGIAYKFDTMTIELEDSNGTLTNALGIAVSFPHQPDAKGFIIDWRQTLNGLGALAQGCYRVRINWTKAGNSGWFYHGAYELLEYSIFNAAGTTRLYVVLNCLAESQGINYKDSGFAGTVRFKGIFGFMQPNYNTVNNTHTDKTRYMVSNISIETYELRTSFLLHCQTRLINKETLLPANQIYVTDHNAANHYQNIYDFPVIIHDEESPSFEYPKASVYAKITAKFFNKREYIQAKYDGDITGSENGILQLPTSVASCSPSAVTLDSAPLLTIPSGTTSDANLVDQLGATITPLSIIGGVIEVDQTPRAIGGSAQPITTGEATALYNRPFYTLPIIDTVQQLNHFGTKWAFTGTTGGHYDRDDLTYKDVNGLTTTRALAYPDDLLCDWRSLDNNGNFLMFNNNHSYLSSTRPAAVTTLLTATIGTFTGFRPCTLREGETMQYATLLRSFGYEEFYNTASFFNFHTSTEYITNAGYTLGNNYADQSVANQFTVLKVIVVRDTNISEL